MVSIRARGKRSGIELEVVDEYQTAFSNYRRQHSRIPSQGEMFDLLMGIDQSDGAGSWVRAVIEGNSIYSVDDALDFVSFDSNVYPDLNLLLRD